MVFLTLFSGFSSVGSGSVRNISLYSKFFRVANRTPDGRSRFGRVVTSDYLMNQADARRASTKV
jgi:hypothetical protein